MANKTIVMSKLRRLLQLYSQGKSRLKKERGDHYNLLFFNPLNVGVIDFQPLRRVIPGRLERPTNRTGICHSIH